MIRPEWAAARVRGTVAIALAGALAIGCTLQTSEPALPPETPGPLTTAQAEQLVEEPLLHLTQQLSSEAGDYADFYPGNDGPVVELVDGTCTYTSTVHYSERQVDSRGWGVLARKVEPQMQVWQMDKETRAIGRGLHGTNPHNDASLAVMTWNGHMPDNVDGPTFGLQAYVEVPVKPEECQ